MSRPTNYNRTWTRKTDPLAEFRRALKTIMRGPTGDHMTTLLARAAGGVTKDLGEGSYQTINQSGKGW